MPLPFPHARAPLRPTFGLPDDSEKGSPATLRQRLTAVIAETTRSQFLGLLTATATCTALGVPKAVSAANLPVRVLTSALDAAAQPFYAADMNFFTDAGLDAQVIEAANGAVITNGIAAGAADIGFASLTSVVTAFSKGIPYTIVAPGSAYDREVPTSALLVAKNAPFQTARDLNGKIIAASGLGTITEFAARVWIDKNGGDSKSVHMIEMTQAVILDALVSGRIDAAILAEPWLYQGKRVARVLANAYDAIAPHFLVGAFFANIAWAKANALTVARFQTAIARSAAWANTHHDQSGQILAKYGKYSPDVVTSMLRIAYQVSMQPSDLQPLINVLAKYGAIPQPIPAQSMIFTA